VAVADTAGLGAAAGSERDPPALVGCETDLSFCPSAASAPAARICSSVGAADFFSRGLDLRGAGVSDSEGTCSEGCGACLGGSLFFSRATITSCACICPARTKLQSSAQKNPFSIKKPDKRITPFTSPRSSDAAKFNQADGAPGLPATESEGAIRSQGKSPRDATRIAEIARRRNNARSLRGPPSPSIQTRPPPAR
jgi:hypothetical protein